MTTTIERRERPVRQPRPEGEPRPVRSTRSTRSTRPAPVPSIEKETTAPAGVRPSTRSTRSTRPSTRQAPIEPVKRKTPRQPPAEPLKSSVPVRVIRTEAVVQDELPRSKRNMAESRNGEPRVRKSTRNVIRTEPGEVVTRTEVFTEKREQARFIAPAQFLLVTLCVVAVSVFAFGLLRGEPEQALPEKPDMHETIQFEPSSTSTNTGILRGQDGD